jgi:hypothetical protein
VKIVEQENQESFRLSPCFRFYSTTQIARRRFDRSRAAFRHGALLNAEPGYLLQIVLIKYLKIFPVQIAHRAALGIANHNLHQDRIYFHLNLGGTSWRRRLVRLLRRKARAPKDNEAAQGYR